MFYKKKILISLKFYQSNFLKNLNESFCEEIEIKIIYLNLLINLLIIEYKLSKLFKFERD